MKTYTVQEQSFDLTAVVTSVGRDICIMITGGEEHVGSVSMAVSRPSLDGSGEMSATVSTYNFTGHKDDVVGNRFAHAVCAASGRQVVAVCGIHVDGATEELITQIVNASEKLLKMILKDIGDA